MNKIKPKIYLVLCCGCKRIFKFEDLIWFNMSPICSGCFTFKNNKINLSKNNLMNFGEKYEKVVDSSFYCSI